jgi:hypothetical protein
LQGAAPGKLYSKGTIPWRLLAYLLKVSPEVERVRAVLRKRLMDDPRIRASEKQLDQMLLTLARGGFVTLDPPFEERGAKSEERGAIGEAAPSVLAPRSSLLAPQPYSAVHATPTPELDKLLVFRSVHPLYGAFLLKHLGIADRNERIQALESVLELPRPLLRSVRVPWPDQMPPGPLATTRLDPELIQRGLIAAPVPEEEDDEEEYGEPDWRDRPPTLADKLRLMFEVSYPEVEDVHTQSVWAAGALLERYAGNFNKYVQGADLVKQEGIVFRHLLRLILLCEEFAQVTPDQMTEEQWRGFLRELSEQLTASCREVDPTSTDEMIQMAHAAGDVVEGEAEAKPAVEAKPPEPAAQPQSTFGAVIFD